MREGEVLRRQKGRGGGSAGETAERNRGYGASTRMSFEKGAKPAERSCSTLTRTLQGRAAENLRHIVTCLYRV